MVAISVTPVRVRPDGKQEVQAFIVSDNAPTALPTSGEGVQGMNESHVFAPFSILYVVGEADTKLYITNESGEFVAQ